MVFFFPFIVVHSEVSHAGFVAMSLGACESWNHLIRTRFRAFWCMPRNGLYDGEAVTVGLTPSPVGGLTFPMPRFAGILCDFILTLLCHWFSRVFAFDKC